MLDNWNRDSHPLQRDQFGVWSITLPDINGEPQIKHKSKIKISIINPQGNREDRIPAWARVVWVKKNSHKEEMN